MTGYLRRLATTGAAYTASSVISKLIAVALLPLYTRYLTPADYGAAEVLITGVIAASIVIRLGIIEALLRFYYQADEAPDETVRTAFASLFWTTTIGLALALPFAEPLSKLLLGHSDPGPDAHRDLRALGVHDVRVPHRALPAGRARQGLLLLHGRQRPGDDPGDGLAGGWGGQGRERAALGPVRHRGRLPGRAGARPEAATRADPRLPALAPHAALGPADDAGGALPLLAQLHRPGADRPARRPRRRRPLQPLGQVRPGRQRAGQGLPARLAAARVFDQGRRRGPPRLRGDRHLVRLRDDLRGRRHVAAQPLDRPRPRRARVLRLLQDDRPGLDRA